MPFVTAISCVILSRIGGHVEYVSAARVAACWERPARSMNEILFVDMEPANGDYEPLIGYIILEQAQAAVDMLGHRLVPVKGMDLK